MNKEYNRRPSAWLLLFCKLSAFFDVFWILLILLTYTAWKVPKYGVFSGLYFPVFSLNTEIYGVNLRIQSECRKIRTRKNSVFGHISRSAIELARIIREIITIKFVGIFISSIQKSKLILVARKSPLEMT